MDCLDCHNVVAHRIAPTAEEAVDRAMASGELPRALPFVRREGVRLVQAKYPTPRRPWRQSTRGCAASTRRSRAGRCAALGTLGHRAAERLSTQRVPDDERHVRRLSGQHRAHDIAGLLPLPRWRPQRQGRVEHHGRLRVVPQDAGDGSLVAVDRPLFGAHSLDRIHPRRPQGRQHAARQGDARAHADRGRYTVRFRGIDAEQQ